MWRINHLMREKNRIKKVHPDRVKDNSQTQASFQFGGGASGQNDSGLVRLFQRNSGKFGIIVSHTSTQTADLF